jgi:hypothetical protein
MVRLREAEGFLPKEKGAETVCQTFSYHSTLKSCPSFPPFTFIKPTRKPQAFKPWVEWSPAAQTREVEGRRRVGQLKFCKNKN